ncbi:MAG: type VI secretion system tip protein VgrG [Williamsia sp.]|nr:type VI secretion system tip protein VgrG [Williamsia sp.]
MSSDSTALATRDQATDLVNFKILLKGSAINGEYAITSLHLVKTFNKISFARITITDGDPAKQDFAISSTDDKLVPGGEIEIALGYHAQAQTIFKGIIIKHALKSTKNKQSSLTIEAKDKAIKLALGRNNHCYIDKTDKDIIEAIAKRAGFGGSDLDVENTSIQHKQMVQYNAVDWDFIVTRAEMNGMLVLTDNNKLVIKAPDTNQQPAKELTYGVDVIEFESEIDAPSQVKDVKTHAWNFTDQKIEDSPSASIPFKESGNVKGEDLAKALGQEESNLVHTGSLNKDELKAWGNAKLLKSKLAKAMGRIKLKGTTEIKPGQVIKLNGFSKRFNGPVLVTGIKQTYDHSIWETEVQFGLPEQWFYQREDVVEKPAAGLLPGIHGLQIGTVIQLENDPDNQDRVKIQLPLIDKGESIWARIASLDAGNERGAFFRPEVQDEVVVGFLNDDPRYPVVLGMLNSGAKPAPVQAKDTNHEKGFVTRSKMKLFFNDEKKTISIETPKGKKIVIDEDSDSILLTDERSNKLTMDANGISIESAKDISLKAASGNIKLEALNIENKANVKFSAEANASATIQSSGQTVVKGGIVNIN